MAHPQHNFTSNFKGSDGHNAELTLNINGAEKKYTPAGNDQTYNVPGVARIDINLDGADLVQAIQTALDGAAQPVLVERSVYDEEVVYQYIGDMDGSWYFGTCTVTKIVTIAVDKEDGAVNGEQIPIVNGVVIVPSDGLNVYAQLRTALGLGQLPVLNYVGTNPVYAQYEKTADNGDLIFVGAFATQSTSSRVQFTIYTVASDNTITTTSCESFSGNYDDLSDKPSTVFMAAYDVASYSDVANAYFHNEQLVICIKGNYLYQLKEKYSNKFIFVGTVDKDDGTFETITLNSSNVWTIETHNVDEYCVYRKSYDALHPLSTAATATDISNGCMDVEFDLGNADGFDMGDGNTLVFIGIPNRGGPSGVNFADAFTKIELYAINENDTPFLAAKVKDTSKDDYGDTLLPGDYYMWNRTYSGNGISAPIVKKFRVRYYLNMNTAWVPNLATKFYIYFTILL